MQLQLLYFMYLTARYAMHKPSQEEFLTKQFIVYDRQTKQLSRPMTGPWFAYLEGTCAYRVQTKVAWSHQRNRLNISMPVYDACNKWATSTEQTVSSTFHLPSLRRSATVLSWKANAKVQTADGTRLESCPLQLTRPSHPGFKPQTSTQPKFFRWKEHRPTYCHP